AISRVTATDMGTPFERTCFTSHHALTCDLDNLATARSRRRDTGVATSRPVPSCKETAVARVKMIKPEDADAETRKVYDGVVKQWGRVSNFSQVLAHQPAALAGWMLPNDAIRLANVKPDPDYVKIQQLVIIKTTALNRSAY